MGRPPIDDCVILREIALIVTRSPGIKFADALRRIDGKKAHQIVGNSPEAVRRRLQRKFNRNRNFFISEARGEQAARRREIFEKFSNRMALVGDELHKRVELLAKAIQPNSFDGFNAALAGFRAATAPLNRFQEILQQSAFGDIEKAAKALGAVMYPARAFQVLQKEAEMTYISSQSLSSFVSSSRRRMRAENSS